MRIALLSLAGNPHARKWAWALARAGAKVRVYSPEPGQIEGAEVVHLPPRGRLTYAFYLRHAGAVGQRLRNDHTQLLHPLHLSPFGSWGLWSGFRPIISAAMGADVFDHLPARERQNVRWDDLTPPRNLLSQAMRAARNRWYRTAIQQVVRASVGITADNQALLDALQALFGASPERLKLVRWGVEPAQLEPLPEDILALRRQLHLPADARLVLAPRGARPVYQGRKVLEGIKLWLDRSPGQQVAVMLGAGYGADPQVAAQACELALRQPRFRWVEAPLDARQMAALWSLTDVFVSMPVYDGYSAAVAEGRWVGAIPVVNNIPGHREVIVHGDNGLILPQDTAEALADVLEYAQLNLPGLKARFAPRNRQWLQEHSLLAPQAEAFLAWADGLLADTPKRLQA